jgi:hypothetical protein
MATVIIEQYNPANGYWNKLYEVDKKDFDPEVPFTVDKYGGPYRTRIVGEEVIKEVVKTKPKKKSKVKFNHKTFISEEGSNNVDDSGDFY